MVKTQVRDGGDENGRRGVSDEFRGRMLRGGRGESGGGVGAVLLFPGGMVLNVMIEHRQGQG